MFILVRLTSTSLPLAHILSTHTTTAALSHYRFISDQKVKVKKGRKGEMSDLKFTCGNYCVGEGVGSGDNIIIFMVRGRY